MEVSELRRELVHSFCEVEWPYKKETMRDIEALDLIMSKYFGQYFNKETNCYE